MFTTSTPLFSSQNEEPNLTFNIRRLTTEDAPWVSTFWIEHWGSEIMVLHGEICNSTGLPGFVAENDGRVLGLATYRFVGPDCELMSLDSMLECRGIGTALLESVIEAARTASCPRLYLTTTNDNMYALRFYQKRGFRLINLRPGALDESRRIKPSIPLIGNHGIPLRDELELEKTL